MRGEMLMKLRTYLAELLSSLKTLTNSQRKFLTEIVCVLLAMRGRANFTNMSRYTHYHEHTIRRHYSQSVDFVALNCATMTSVQAAHLVGVFDCSFIPQSGDCTYGRDKFWSGSTQNAQYGLEISVVGCIDTHRKQAWTVDVRQTPAGRSPEKQEAEDTYTRVNFYLDQVDDLIRHPAFPAITHWVSDGYYAKTKVFDRITGLGKHLITKLRGDANVKYVAIGKQRNGTRGTDKTYDGKVDYADLSRFIDTKAKTTH